MLIPLGILDFPTGAAGAYELIESNILTSSASSVTFSSIPQDYKHLQIRVAARSLRTGVTLAYTGLRLNSDTSANYARHRLYGDGSGVNSQASTGQSYIEVAQNPTESSTAGIFGGYVVDILDYSSTNKNTTVRSLTGMHETTYKWIGLQSGVWLNTSGVSSITLFDQSTGFTSGSRFSLYGVKG